LNPLPKGLYGITSKDFGYSHIESAKILIKAGVKIIQYREKNSSTRTMLNEALEIKKLCKKHNVIFIVNDRIDIAMAIDADGIHLGQEDMPIKIAKKIMPEKIIGISVSSINEAIDAQNNMATYIGVGSVFPTSTKNDADVIGVSMLKGILDLVRIPAYAIGGITLQNIEVLKEYPLYGVAVISAIFASKEPVKVAHEFNKRWNR
jgi:thiamine-phosphate pyrophosphorylase